MNNLQIATLASGCFWCYQPIFESPNGVSKVTVGYAGGEIENPSYEDVSYRDTGHAEAYQVEFDPSVISYEQLLDVFFYVHDPTTLNRQGADVGTQYRSAIFYHSDDQKKIAEEAVVKHQDEFSDPIVTEIAEFTNFYTAEEYHQKFFDKNPNYPYCTVNIGPKMKKFKKKFSELIDMSV